MKNKLIVIYNTCGISGRENVPLYIENIHAILNQKFDNFKVVLSSCLNTSHVRTSLLNEFRNKISYNLIDTMIPVNISFNHSVMKAVETFGIADGYLYVSSGISLEHDKNIIQKLYDLHVSGPYGITSARVDKDSGLVFWLLGGDIADESRQEEIFQNGNFIVPVGKTVNSHCEIFDHSLFEAFDSRLMPDIFASQASESIWSFITACLHKKIIIHKDAIVRHLTGSDGGSSGFRPEWTGQPGWKHTLPYAPIKIEDIIAQKEAKDCGMGYEECQKILLHDPNKFDINGHCIDSQRLKTFLMNFYLPKENFRYDLISSTFII